MRKIVGAKFPLRLKEPMQLDVNAMAPVCRPATDIYLFDRASFPPKVLEAIEEKGFLLEEAVFIFRKMDYWRIGLTKSSARQFHKSLMEAGFIRCDLSTRSFGYAKLMRDAGINISFITGLDKIGRNEEYEKGIVPGYDEMKQMDLKIRNRLSERQARIIRMHYGLDGKVYSKREIVDSFKDDPEDERLSEAYPKAARLTARSNAKYGRIMAARRMALGILSENRDDRHEYVGKLLAELYDLAWGIDPKNDSGKRTLKDFDMATISEYLHEIGILIQQPI